MRVVLAQVIGCAFHLAQQAGLRQLQVLIEMTIAHRLTEQGLARCRGGGGHRLAGDTLIGLDIHVDRLQQVVQDNVTQRRLRHVRVVVSGELRAVGNLRISPGLADARIVRCQRTAMLLRTTDARVR